MQRLRTLEAIHAFTQAQRAAGRRIGFVPTMGALHEGHLSLIDIAARHADVVLASVFINPLQFGPGEDLARYPRDEAGDLDKLQSRGVAAAFLPTPEIMYPPGSQTRVRVEGLTAPLCGAARPGHFEGVTTVVLKLLMITRCDVAIFGEKDYQQLAVIRRMVMDLNLPVEICSGPIVREPDGLAMSSRNAYLSAAARAAAASLPRALGEAAAAYAAGQRDPRALEALARAALHPMARVDYLEIRDALTLDALNALDRPAILAAAVYFGQTRLLDNVPLA